VTELAYLADMPSAYVRTFRARITALPPGSVVLDRTYFYPTGGGQPCDRGTIALGGGPLLEVVDVRKAGLSVYHRVQGPAEAVRRLAVGSEVEGTLDWDRRHLHMRLHTAQHFLSARVFVRTRLRTQRANLAGASATIDLEGALPPNEVDGLVEDLREAGARPRPVSIRMIPRAAWDANPSSERSGLVPLPPQVDPVRVVEIEESDVCPCGGTHVRSTAEIGPVRLSPPALRTDGTTRLAFTLEEAGPSTPPA
jgi:misacylated tRNA(Ala) deacylase